MSHLSFREELHAIEAVIAGQGIGIVSVVLVEHELAAGTLVRDRIRDQGRDVAFATLAVQSRIGGHSNACARGPTSGPTC